MRLRKSCPCGWSGDLVKMADHEGKHNGRHWEYSARCPQCGTEVNTGGDDRRHRTNAHFRQPY